ncbi:MAG TPA: tetratricopeptide repeat protein [Steroidobacteraceae bacterium]|nr:tetratricopeptide repeat protein [Steroidobacteraceae bacterium]
MNTERLVAADPTHADATLQNASAAYTAGAWQQAEQLCRQILAANGEHPAALELLGIIAAQTGRAAEATQLLQRAVYAAPRNAQAHFNYANVLHAVGSVESAVASYARAIAIEPEFAEAYNNQGNALLALHRFSEALESYQRALNIRPEFPEALINRALAWRGAGRLEEALQSCVRALQLDPGSGAALLTHGIVLQDLHRTDAALVAYDRALSLRPDCAEAHKNRGDILYGRGQLHGALASYKRALHYAPGLAEACQGSANVLRELRRLHEALDACNRAVRSKPDLPEAYNTRGVILQDLGRLEDALESFQAALALRPEYADAFRNRGGVLQELGRYAEALETFAQAQRISPDYPWLLGTLLFTQLQVCDWTDFAARLDRLVRKIDEGHKVTQPFAALALFDSPRLQRLVAASWAGTSCPPEDEVAALRGRPPNAMIRLGYFSADYHDHATTYLAAGLFESHDRRRFRLVGFSFGPKTDDGMRRRVASACDEFIDVSGLADRDVARLSRDKQIDIAIDLKGFTQNSRPGIFAHRAAPVQVSYLGYPGTMAAPYMDYLVADHVLIPRESRAQYSERLVYLPHSYQVNDRNRRIDDREFSRVELSLPEDAFVFCCFNNCWKITPEVFDGWMRILQATPHGILWLLASSETATRNLRRQALTRGVAEGRLVFAPRVALAEHLARQRAADLCLDTIPYNAHTTASDALWAGVPILTRLGESFASRVTASLLHAVGMSELITRTTEEYEATATALAANPERLALLRAKLNAQRLSSPLFDTRLFTAHLEVAYAEMHRRCQAAVLPEDMDVRALLAS